MLDMKRKFLVLLTAALLVPAGFALAQPTGETDNDKMNWADAAHGLCTAYGASEEGRSNGNASHAPPFVWLQDEADSGNQSVTEYCDTVPHPSENANDRADERGENGNTTGYDERPDDAGPPEDEGRPDDAGKPDEAGDS